MSSETKFWIVVMLMLASFLCGMWVLSNKTSFVCPKCHTMYHPLEG